MLEWHSAIDNMCFKHNSEILANKKHPPIRNELKIILAVVVAIAASLLLYKYVLRDSPLVAKLRGRTTVEEQLNLYGAEARMRLNSMFQAAGLPYPPAKIVILGLKEEKDVELFAAGADGKLKFVTRYPIMAASGKAGPKLHEGDFQVPEGFYRVEALQPTTPYHLAMRLNYPNDFDKQKGREDGRMLLGSDIMIHGTGGSIGCLSMEDATAEDLFVLAADSGINRVDVLLLPCDFRKGRQPIEFRHKPAWLPDLYQQLRVAVEPLKRTPALQ